MDDIPNSAAINEAVELDKGYDEPDTVAFVNGVLGGFMRGEFSANPGKSGACRRRGGTRGQSGKRDSAVG